MPRNNWRAPFCGLLLALALLAGGAGCSREARHEVLIFFFTGVPDLDAPEEPDEFAETSGPVLSRREQLLAERAKAALVYAGPYAHGPYAANGCEQCHEMASGAGYSFGSSVDVDKKSIVPGEFILPPEQLCTACHATKGLAAAQAGGLILHGPAWSCTTCHDPHTSKESALLRVTADQVCRQCHSQGFIHDADLHEGVEDCLDCHNPHLGRDSRMLREDFEETF